MGFILMQHSLESLNIRLRCSSASELFRTFLELLNNLRPTLKELIFESAQNMFLNEQTSLPLPTIDEFFQDKSLMTLTLDRRIFNSFIKKMDVDVFEGMPHLQSLSFGEAEA